MIFESKLKRTYWTQLAVSTVIEIVIVSIVASIFDMGFAGGLVLLVIIQAVYLLVWLRNTLVGWTFFYLWRNQAVLNLYDYLNENNFPAPQNYHSSIEDYFHEVIGDIEKSDELRFKAANELATIRALASHGQIQTSTRLTMLWEDALQMFKRSSPAALSASQP